MSEEFVEEARGPDGNLGYLFRLAHQAFTASLSAALAPMAISPAQYGVLSAFESGARYSSAELARRAGVRPQTMNDLVRSLTDGGHLESRPDPANNRILRLRLTRKGSALLTRATAAVREVEGAALEHLSHADQLVVRTWLSALARHAS